MGAIDSAQHDRELVIRTLMENKEAHLQNIRGQFEVMFAKMDNDESGSISFEEFEEHFEDESVAGFFLLLDIDASDAYALFKLLDDDSSGSVDVAEFVDGCLRLQGSARSIDLAKVRHEQRFMIKQVMASLGKHER